MSCQAERQEVLSPASGSVRWPERQTAATWRHGRSRGRRGEDPPERLALRAHQVLTVPPDEALANLVADLRGRFPRQVGVVGPGAPEVAVQLTEGGPAGRAAPDDVEPRPEGLEGVEVVPTHRPGPADRGRRLAPRPGRRDTRSSGWTGRAGTSRASCFAKLELLNPGGSVKDRPAIAMIDEAERQGLLEARVDDRGRHVGEHRDRSCDRGRPPALPVHLRHARQDGPGEDRAAPRVRRRGGGVPDRGRPGPPRLLLLGDRPAGQRRSRARSTRTSTRIPRTRSRTSSRPAPRSGARPRAGSPTSSPGSAPAGRSPGSAGT